MGCSICGQSGHNCKTCISGDIKSEVNNSCLCNSITKQNYDEGYDNGYDAGVDLTGVSCRWAISLRPWRTRRTSHPRRTPTNAFAPKPHSGV